MRVLEENPEALVTRRHGETCVGDGSGRRCYLTLPLSENFPAKNNSILTRFEEPGTGRARSPLCGRGAVGLQWQ